MIPLTSFRIPPARAWLAAALPAGVRVAGTVLGVLALVAAGGSTAAAQTLGVTAVMRSDTALTLDSNKPQLDGPHAQYVGFEITNTSGVVQTDLRASIAGFAGGIALAGGQPASIYIGTMQPGEKRTAYWFVSYPAHGSAYGTANTLTVTVSNGAGSTRTATGRVRVVSMASASAGGFTNSTTIGAGAVLGQLINVDITYQFKGWQQGETFNMQPAGNTDFSGGCFQLMSSVILSADAPLSAFIAPNTRDRQFFVATNTSDGGGSIWNARMRYTFKYMCTGVTSTPNPYANSFSGGQLKYVWSGEGGGGSGIPAAPSPGTSFTVTKTASAQLLPNGGQVTYTVTINNISTFNISLDSIRDKLPTDGVYAGMGAGSGVTAANSGSMPAAGSGGTVVWRGNPSTGNASDATNTYYVPAGGNLKLVYNVTLPAAQGDYTNTATPFVGATPLPSASATVAVGSADVSVAKSGPATAMSGDTVRYAITVTSAGGAAKNVVVVDSLPAGVTFLSANKGGVHSGGKVTWPAIASLASGAPVVDSVTVIVTGALGATFVNVARASSPTYDSVQANNDGSAAASRVTTTLVGSVRVTPDGLGAPLARVPGKYAQPFEVQNNLAAAGTFHLLASVAGTAGVLAIDSIRGPGITAQTRADSAQVVLAGKSTTSYTVYYRVLDGDSLPATEYLLARHAATPAYRDSGYVDVQRVGPFMKLVKSVTPNTAVYPGVPLTYQIQISNTGSRAAAQVEVFDALPEQVFFKLGSISHSLPAGMTATASYSRNRGESYDYVPVSGNCDAPVTLDGCVTNIRWTLTGLLPAGSGSAGTITFLAHVR